MKFNFSSPYNIASSILITEQGLKVFLKTKTQSGNSRDLIQFYYPYLVSGRRPAINHLVLVR